MRKLHLYRERALFCFANTYYCVPGFNVEELKEAAEQIGYPDILKTPGFTEIGMINGQRVVFDVPESEGHFVVAAYRDCGPFVSNLVEVPAGTDDLYYKIITDYNGNNRVALRVEEEK